MGIFSRRRRGAVVASAATLEGKDSDRQRRLKLKWQDRAMAYYELPGVCWIAAQFLARPLGQIRTFPAIRDPATGDITEVKLEGDLDEGEDLIPDAQKIIEQWNRVQDPGGGRQQMQERYGQLMFLHGEGNLTASIDKDTELEVWEFLSIDEIQIADPRTYKRYEDEGTTPKTLRKAEPGKGLSLGEALVYRMWTPHPRFSQRADAPARAILDDLEEIVYLNATVHARSTSRVSGPGILLVPNEVSEAPPKPLGDEDPLEDPLMEEMVEAFTTPHSDPSSPTSVTPMILRGPAEALKEVRLLKITEASELYPEAGMREEAIARIEIKLSMPSGKLVGASKSNHWNAWLADEEAWDYIAPYADRMCADFASVVLRPLTKAAGVADWENVCIGYDNSAVVNHPDRAQDAKDLYELEVIGPRPLLEATGFKVGDMPTPDELAVMRANKAVAQPAPTEPGADEPVDPANPEKGSPPMEEPTEPVVAAGVSRTEHYVSAAAMVALDRSREVAGSRLWRTASNSCEECAEAVRGQPKDQIAAILGAETLAQIGADDPRKLVAGGTDSFSRTLVRMGLERPTIERLSAAVEEHAAATLFDRDPTPVPGIAGILFEDAA